jgi:hypothetical protein
MEKYRKWTDETAGVNPFVAAQTQRTTFVEKTLGWVVGLVKVAVLLAYLPVFVVVYLLPISILRSWATKIMLALVGCYSQEDYALAKLFKSGQPAIVVSNHTCFIDVLYYLWRLPGCSFVAYSENDKGDTKYRLLSPLSTFFSLFRSLQPFFKADDEGNASLKELLEGNSSHVVVFYEKIRTNGRGTIRIDRQLTDSLYELERTILIAQLKYTFRRDELFSLTSSGFSTFFAALASTYPGNNLKVRALKQCNSPSTQKSRTRTRLQN